VDDGLAPGPTRDLTVAVFVVWQRSVLLHFHAKLGRWLPPGGHVEPNELPDDAAVREVMEETGIEASLVCERLNEVEVPGQPRQLCRPAGVQLADISPGHQHIDLVYFATSQGGTPAYDAGWFDEKSWQSLDLTVEVRTWCELAVAEIDRLSHE
jgi:8-oxo-dGTP pyrophosphatase MutT (NUDIX family)